MDLLLFQIRAAYRENPGFTIFFFALSIIVGVVIGYGLVGPALFG